MSHTRKVQVIGGFLSHTPFGQTLFAGAVSPGHAVKPVPPFASLHHQPLTPPHVLYSLTALPWKHQPLGAGQAIGGGIGGDGGGGRFGGDDCGGGLGGGGGEGGDGGGDGGGGEMAVGSCSVDVVQTPVLRSR